MLLQRQVKIAPVYQNLTLNYLFTHSSQNCFRLNISVFFVFVNSKSKIPENKYNFPPDPDIFQK